MLKCAEMRLKTMNLGVTFVHRLQKLQVEKADGWEQTKPHKVGNNLPWIDINMKKKKEREGNEDHVFQMYKSSPFSCLL